MRGKIALAVLFFMAAVTIFWADGQQVREEHSLYWQQRVTHFRSLPDSPDEIIFLGDSITDGGNWSEMFESLRVKNRGISGDTAVGLLDRLDEVLSSKPAKIFLMIGINDLGKGRTESFLLANIKRILKEIKRTSPATAIYLQSLLPVSDRFSVFPTYVNKTPQILAVNKVLRRMSEEYKLHYIDLYSAFADEQSKLSGEFTNDGLHLTGAGYLLWKSVIDEHVGR